jgi:CspA family cold shock protein
MDGYRALDDGDTVSFVYEHAAQDGFRFRAIRVWPRGVDPSTELPASLHHGQSRAYESTLTLHMDDGRILTGDEVREIARRADEHHPPE